MRLLTLIALLIAFFLTLPFTTAQAQNAFDLSELRDGETLLNISATESVEVPQDLLVANLQYMAEGQDKRAIQNEVNMAIKKALDTIKQEDGIKYATLGYNIYQYTPPKTRSPIPGDHVTRWRAQQGIELKSKDSDKLLELVGKLQDMKLDLKGLNFTLSPELYAKTSDDLIAAALVKLQTSADKAAKALGKTSVSFVEVNVNSSGFRPQPVYRGAHMEMAMAADSMAAPSAEPGETQVSLTVSTRALLKP